MESRAICDMLQGKTSSIKRLCWLQDKLSISEDSGLSISYYNGGNNWPIV
jgi:hypothetical protein